MLNPPCKTNRQYRSTEFSISIRSFSITRRKSEGWLLKKLKERFGDHKLKGTLISFSLNFFANSVKSLRLPGWVWLTQSLSNEVWQYSSVCLLKCKATLLPKTLMSRESKLLLIKWRKKLQMPFKARSLLKLQLSLMNTQITPNPSEATYFRNSLGSRNLIKKWLNCLLLNILVIYLTCRTSLIPLMMILFLTKRSCSSNRESLS